MNVVYQNQWWTEDGNGPKPLLESWGGALECVGLKITKVPPPNQDWVDERRRVWRGIIKLGAPLLDMSSVCNCHCHWQAIKAEFEMIMFIQNPQLHAIVSGLVIGERWAVDGFTFSQLMWTCHRWWSSYNGTRRIPLRFLLLLKSNHTDRGTVNNIWPSCCIKYFTMFISNKGWRNSLKRRSNGNI